MAIRAMSNLGDSPDQDSDGDTSVTWPTPPAAAAAASAVSKSPSSDIKMDANNHLGAHMDPIAEYAEQHSTKEHPYLSKVMSTSTLESLIFFLFRVRVETLSSRRSPEP
jgi:hypothetical protein